MADTSLAIRIQTWADDLRLPCLTDHGVANTLAETFRDLANHPVPFQSKHLPALKRNVWFALRRPRCRSRSGLLCILPAHNACLYISGEVTGKRPAPRVALLRLRLDPTFLSAGVGNTVFTATLSAADRCLFIEDVLLWKGRRLSEETFQTRWRLICQWIEHYCLLDSRLLGGIDIKAAEWQSLTSIVPEGVWELQSDEGGRRRLLWIANNDAPAEVISYEGPSVPHLDLPPQAPDVFAVRESGGPDQWTLERSDGSKLGSALIRRLAVSTALRSATGARVSVEVAWSDDFSKWEITGCNEQNQKKPA